MSQADESKVNATKNILVVDDDLDIRIALSELLEDEGYTVGTAANGFEALTYLREHPLTFLVLLDLMMPMMDGFQFRAEQKNNPKIASIPVIVMTAQPNLKPGAIDIQEIIPKSLSLDKLVDAIHRAEQGVSMS